MRDAKRITTWWIRWTDLDWPSPDNLDKIRRNADRIAASNATTAMVFGTHFRWDYLPYFTILHDYLATVAEELHRRGVELYDHHSVNLVHRYDTREQMRHVMLHSGPHLPFSPSREAAASWEYHGRRLNDWRMIDVRDGSPLYYPQYAGEGFCPNNPEFVDAYVQYAKELVRDTGIDGLSADDPIHYMHFASCGCRYCRAALKERTGLDLPPVTDRSFWGNWDNPAWRAWCDLRLDATGSFFRKLSAALPEGFELMSCGNASASPKAVAVATDGKQFLQGCTRVNLEMGGNTPPYHDPLTTNRPIILRYVVTSLHQAQALEKGARCYGTVFAFTETTANIAWAANKALGSDCHLITLKPRLGLPQRILDTLPDESDIVGRAFTYEKEHPALFEGAPEGHAAVYYSYETRDHTLFGSLYTGYYADYEATLRTLLRRGDSPVTVTAFPPDAREHPVILLPSAVRLSEDELAALRVYLKSGGKVVATGPCAVPECASDRVLPNVADGAPEDFFRKPGADSGIHVTDPAWQKLELPKRTGGSFSEVAPGLFFHPGRATEDGVTEAWTAQLDRLAPPQPVTVDAEGYFVTVFRSEESRIIHLFAEEYETDVDHKLDEMRYHRSRVNYVNHAKPIRVSRTVRVHAESAPEVFLPFHAEAAQIVRDGDAYAVTLPEDCFYAILRFPV